jgi:RNA polymerase-binding transcription factor DksA
MKADAKKFRAALEAYRRRATVTADSLEAQARSPVGGGELSNAPMHLGDQGTEEYLHGLNSTLLENENHVLTEVDDALGRLDAGTFGVCENCGQEIPKARLEAIPYARYCVPCTQALQSETPANLNTGRPHDARDILPTRTNNPTAETDDSELHPDTVPAADRENKKRGRGDVHAAGTPGGGSAVGGLAGTNIGAGSPDGAGLEDAMGSSNFDAALDKDDPEVYSGPSGGAVGGTPANKRAVGGRGKKK